MFIFYGNIFSELTLLLIYFIVAAVQHKISNKKITDKKETSEFTILKKIKITFVKAASEYDF